METKTFYYRVHNSPPFVNLSHINPVHYFAICFNIILPPRPRSVKWSLTSGFPIKITYFWGTFPSHFILIYMKAQITLGEEYNKWSFSLYNFM